MRKFAKTARFSSSLYSANGIIGANGSLTRQRSLSSMILRAGDPEVPHHWHYEKRPIEEFDGFKHKSGLSEVPETIPSDWSMAPDDDTFIDRSVALRYFLFMMGALGLLGAAASYFGSDRREAVLRDDPRSLLFDGLEKEFGGSGSSPSHPRNE